jgi:arabinofuranan 3-O-arabinosyltransferase
VAEQAPRISADRLRLAAVCLALALLVFTQSSGLEAADTKLDLVVSPWHFLTQAVSMWDPTAAAGQLQNQAYGYLFPMGPFFLLGHLMQLPPWVVQRAWESSLVIVAFLGTFRLARLLGVKGWWPRVAAGLIYALAPRTLMELGVISAELLPTVIAPWVLIPLVRGSREGSTRRAGMLSGVALLFAGGTNAAATLAILPLPALWLITRSRGPRRGSLTRWWVLGVALSSLWWAIPLAVLGKYSAPFLNWIESSAVTTGPTSLATTLRGAEHWEAYLGSGVWPGGSQFVTSRPVVAATAVVAAVGVIGLLLRHTSQRLFLGLSLATGLVLVTFGHVASVGPLLAGHERLALDGSLNAFRNVHKFDPVLRLPIAIGTGHALSAAVRWASEHVQLRLPNRMRPIPSAVVVIAIALWVGTVAIAPVLAGQMVPQARQVNEPTWWTQTANWLADHGSGRALVVPGAAQPSYIWGSPRDDALQPVARSPWTVRDAAPLTQPSYIRLLNTVEAQMSAGRDEPTLAVTLARAGIQYVVVRNDLDAAASNATPPFFARATLANSPGFQPQTTFGPNAFGTGDPRRLVDLGATGAAGAVTIYRNTEWQSLVGLYPASQTVVANGLSDTLPELSSAGVGDDQPVVFGALPSGWPTTIAPPEVALTDGTRRREFGFGDIDRYFSATMSASQPFRLQRAAHDYLPDPAPALSTVGYQGITDVSASSSGDDANAIINLGPASEPWSALDGDPITAWRPGNGSGIVGQWLQVDLPKPVDDSVATVSFVGLSRAFPDRIRVTTQSGHLDQTVVANTTSQPIQLPKGATTFVRITILHVADGSPGYSAGISQLTIPGVTATRTLDIPGNSAPDLVSFSVADGARSPCLAIFLRAACDPSWAQSGEEDSLLARSFTVSTSARYDVEAQVRVRPGPALDEFLDSGNPLTARASSVDSSDPRDRPGAALDAETTTGWTASPRDLTPTLTVTGAAPQRVTGIRLRRLRRSATRAPVEVTVRAGRETVRSDVPSDGVIRLPRAVRTTTVSVHVIRAKARITTSSTSGQSTFLPVAIGELRLLGSRHRAPPASSEFAVPCGQGPTLDLDGAPIRLGILTSMAQALAGDPIPAVACPGTRARLRAGQNDVSLGSSSLLTPDAVVMSRNGRPSAAPATRLPLHVESWSATSRSVAVSTTSPALLVVRENANAGWHATLHGAGLTSVLVDGWQQAWIVPAHAAGVIHLEFTPQKTVTAGLVAGAVAVLVLIGLVLWPARAARPSKRPRAPLRQGTLPRGTAAVGVVVALVLLGSAAGAAVAVVVLVADRWRRSDASLKRVALAAGLALAVAAGIETASGTAGFGSAGSAALQLLCLGAVGLVLHECLRRNDPAPRGGEPPQQRRLDEVPAERGNAGGG